MLPDKTTTIGEGESVITERPFHIYNHTVSIRRRVDQVGLDLAYHERSCQDQAKVHDLAGKLPRVLQNGQHWE
jgi:hypothetical protein